MNNHPDSGRRTAMSAGRLIVFIAAASAVVVAAACGSEVEATQVGVLDGGSTGEVPVDGSNVVDPPLGEQDARAPVQCTVPAGYDDCTNRCGPIRNPCTGVIVKQCGGCPDAEGKKQVCDIERNTCITPKITCEELGAECGRIKNSCGIYLDCPDPKKPDIECSAGNPASGLSPQECDPDTHKCKTATSVTCADLGYECGSNWLGIGPKTNKTDCGDCSNFPDRPRCGVFGVCEPACTAPKTAQAKKAFCNAAKAARGVECGAISDGCGGSIDCTIDADFKCPAGQECATRGIANRCDPAEAPLECRAAGRNCGTIKSACGGPDLNCGQCTGTDVCNANGVCGPPCIPKKCADLGDPACLPQPVSDGCGNVVNDCRTCAGGSAACKPNTDADAGAGVGGTCCVPTYTCKKRPAGVSPNACGNALFDNGCGVKLNCGCAEGECGGDGLCCAAAACPAPGLETQSCGTTQLGCGKSCYRGCAKDGDKNDNVCNASNVCCNPEPDSADEWRAKNPGRCAFNISNGCGGFVDAGCLNGTCIDAENGPGNPISDPGGTTPSAVGWCCGNTTSNCSAATTCATAPSACVTGASVSCGAALCANGPDGENDEVCHGAPATCCDPDSCPAPSLENAACTSGNSYPLGCGQSCEQRCAPDGDGNANTCRNGTCCNPEPDSPAEWRSTHPGACAYNISNQCGSLIDAPCGPGLICQNNKAQVTDDGSTFASGTCCNPNDSCGSGSIGLGETCRVSNACLDGQTVTCPCVGGADCYQDKCCAPAACPNNIPVGESCAAFDRGCGRACTPGCVAGSQCYGNLCCKPATCPPPANIGEPCDETDLGCGASCRRSCDTTGKKYNNRCNTTSNKCVCVPDKCPTKHTGLFDDGCGHTINCTPG